MQSTFSGVEIGKRSLLSHQKGLHTIGQNLSNADNPAYSKQRVIFNTLEPLYRPDLTRVETAGRIGQGVEISEIRRERDIYLDTRIQTETSKQSFWSQKQLHLTDIENIHDVLGSNNLQSKLDFFWRSWQEVSKNPSDSPSREELLQSSLNLVQGFRDNFTQLNNLRHEINQKVIAEVNSINNIINQIGKLNQEIRNSQILGDNPNDLLDKRDYLVEQLAEKIDVSVNFNDEDEFMVYTGGRILIQGDKINLFRINNNPQNQDLAHIVWDKIGDDYRPSYGSLAAHLLARDELLTKEITNLDTITSNLIYAVNDIHRQGFNNYGNKTGDFFQVFPYSTQFNGNSDSNADSVLDSTLIFQVKGAMPLNGKEIVGGSGTIRLRSGNPLDNNQLVEINYQSNESIDTIIERLNTSQQSVNFLLDSEGHLIVKTYSNDNPYPFSIQQLEDTGDFLTGIAQVLNEANQPFLANQVDSANSLHPNSTFFRTPIKHISAYINVNPQIKRDSNLIVARGGVDLDPIRGAEQANGIQDGNVAYRISQLRYNPTLIDNKKTIDEFYVQGMTSISSQLSQAKFQTEKYEDISLGLKELRQSVSGVNIDEELAQMIVYQNGYQAGAKIIKMMNDIFDIIMRI